MKKDGSEIAPLRDPKTLNLTDHKSNRGEKGFAGTREITSSSSAVEKYAPPPWVFQHNDLSSALDSAKVIGKDFLKNKLNHIHFMDGYLLILLKHPKYDYNVVLKAKPKPCIGSEFLCELVADSFLQTNLNTYEFLHLVIDDGQCLTVIPAKLKKAEGQGLKFDLPEKGYMLGKRQSRRYACDKIDVELIQRGLMSHGELLNFSPEGFCIRLTHLPHSNFDWSPNSEILTMVHLRRRHESLFSGFCRCTRQEEGLPYPEIVLAPAEDQIKLPDEEISKTSTKSIPLAPVIIFRHPFLERQMEIDVSSISTSGFSTYETKSESVFIQGMIIPNLSIEFAGAIKIECSAQIIKRLELQKEEIYCAFSIIDMDINSYTQLSHILANSTDSHTHISKRVAMDELWEFFFESGFIYPEKYGVLCYNREHFKKTYKKLYHDNPEIAKHFTYQKNGRIYGHISMIRAYERSWMIHHHAARNVNGRRAGFSVLKEVMHYLDDIHRLPSAKMDYAISFFRPENRFPDRVFGGFARDLNDPKGCSMDLFTYLDYTNNCSDPALPLGWKLAESSEVDLWELDCFYGKHSGGLLTSAMALRRVDPEEESLKDVYGRHGFLRDKVVYSLKYEGDLNAILVVELSELGFNLSELLNGIKVFVIDDNGLGWEVLYKAISQLFRQHSMCRSPILVYPCDYVKKRNVPYDKQYYAWVLNVRYGDEYVHYMKKKFRLVYR
ncbi:conserved hypothetical protein [delta proteobacterium NaphS2]|nr:conserved hypothetical protein [delta proteobacterium NaphS2]